LFGNTPRKFPCRLNETREKILPNINMAALRESPVKKKEKEVIDESEVVLADSPTDMCVMRCEICQHDVKNLRMHVKARHFLVPAEYRHLYPQPVHFVKKTFHRCFFIILKFFAVCQGSGTGTGRNNIPESCIILN
jgi:hypothetical protein